MTDEPKSNETPETPETPPAAAPKSRLDYHMQKILDHVWGPTGSVILHILIVVLLVHLVITPVKPETSEIEVTVIEPDSKDLEELEQRLEELEQLEVEVEMPETDVPVDTPEMEPVANSAVSDELAALDIKSEAMSPLIMRGLFAGRSAEGRAGLLRRYGGRHGGATEQAVLNALRWLKKHQAADGSWTGKGGANSSVAMTGVALLAFLSHGETHQSEEFGETVKKAIDFLVAQQIGNGSFMSGRAGGGHGATYANGIATYAISEAYAMTRIPSLRSVMEKAVQFVVDGMQDTGGFDYGYAKSGRRDTSVAGWQAQAVKAAFIAGADVPDLPDKIKKIANGIRMNYAAQEGKFRYAPTAAGGSDANWCVTSIGTLSLQLLGFPSDEKVVGALKAMEELRCNWESPGVGGWPMYAWYYMSQAKFHSRIQTHFSNWNDTFAPALVKNQNQDGSWVSPGGSEKEYGPVYGTAFGAVSLMVYYRFLPTYQEIKEEEAPTETQSDDIVIEIG